MTVDELMIKRVKVISPYPYMPYEVGDILEESTELYGVSMYFRTTDNLMIPAIDVEPYPNIFRPLKWHEERKIEDMPEYMKLSNGIIVKVDIALSNTTHFKVVDGAHLLWLSDSRIPSTKQDYEAYLKTQK